MSVIIRLQNLPWSANAMDIRNFFRGLSIPEGGVHIVGGEQGDAFIAFSTDEDARQAMMHDLGKIKEVQVKLLLSSRSEMHKVIETARQSVPILQLQPLAPAPAPAPPAPAPQPLHISPFAPALSHLLAPPPAGARLQPAPTAIPGLGSPGELPQPAVIAPPSPAAPPSPPVPPAPQLSGSVVLDDRTKERDRKKLDRRRSRSKSRERDKKEARRDRDKKDVRRERSRSRDRSRERRRRSRSRDRRDRKRDRKERSRSRDDSRRSRDKRNDDSNHSTGTAVPVRREALLGDNPYQAGPPADAPGAGLLPGFGFPPGPPMMNLPGRPFAAFGMAPAGGPPGRPGGGALDAGGADRFGASNGSVDEALARLQELDGKRNPNAFQGGGGPGAGAWRALPDRPQLNNGAGRPPARESRPSRFERVVPPGCCVRLENVPTNLGYGDIRRFFVGHFIANNGIKMINDRTGRRSGVVVVKFSDPKGKHAALALDGDELREQRVRIRHLDDAEYEAEVDSFLPVRDDDAPPPASTTAAPPAAATAPPPAQRRAPDRRADEPFTVLRLAELPNYVKEHDIIKKFSEYSLLSINLMDCRETKSRTAYVQFVKPEDARVALERRHLYAFGRKQVVVSACSDLEYARAKNEYTNGDDGVIDLDGDKEEEEAAPAEAEAEAEAPRDPRQRRAPPPPGADAPQPPPAAFPHALVFPPPGAVGFPGPGAPFLPPAAFVGGFPPQLAPRAPWRPELVDDAPPDCVLVKGLSSRATDRTIIDFFSEANVVPSRIHLMLDQTGRPSGDCFCEFRTPEEASAAAARRGSTLEGRTISIDLVDRGVVEDALEGPRQEAPDDEPYRPGPPPQFSSRGAFVPRGVGFFRGRGGFDRGGPRGRGGFDRGAPRGRGFMRGGPRGAPRGGPRGGFNAYGGGGGGGGGDEEPGEPEGFGRPGCVVSLQNVPFRAGIEEILEFFGNFELSQDDVIRRYNELGMPTADARVCFRTPFDAQRAVKTLNRQHIRDRSVFLQIV